MFLLWTSNAFEKAFKKGVYAWLLKKIVWNVFSIQALSRPKIALLNFTIHQFSYSERLIHSKRHLKRSLCIQFKENPLSHFSMRESLPKPEICIPNLDFHQCFFSKRLLYLKRHLQGNYYMLFGENHSNRFFEIRTSEI